MKHTFVEYLEIFYNSPFFTGAAGALTGMLLPNKKVSWRSRIAHLIAGAMTAGYVSPVLIYYCGIENQPLANAIVFICGLTGMYIAGGLLNVGRKFRDDPSGTWEKIKKYIPWKKR